MEKSPEERLIDYYAINELKENKDEISVVNQAETNHEIPIDRNEVLRNVVSEMVKDSKSVVTELPFEVVGNRTTSIHAVLEEFKYDVAFLKVLQGSIREMCRIYKMNKKIVPHFKIKAIRTEDDYNYAKRMRIKEIKTQIGKLEQKITEQEKKEFKLNEVPLDCSGEDPKQLFKMITAMPFDEIIKEAQEFNKKIEDKRRVLEKDEETRKQEKIRRSVEIEEMVKEIIDKENLKVKSFIHKIKTENVFQLSRKYHQLYVEEVIESNVLRTQLGITTKSPMELSDEIKTPFELNSERIQVSIRSGEGVIQIFSESQQREYQNYYLDDSEGSVSNEYDSDY